jgi:uncharacterized protein (TIGR02594 family)
MVQLIAFRRWRRRVSPGVVALALCSAAVAASATPASARSHHGVGKHAHVRHVSRHAAGHVGHRHHRHVRGWDAGVAKMRARGLAGSHASLGAGGGSDIYGGAYSSGAASSTGFGSSNVVAEARRYLGGNPTGRARLWCARFMNMVLQHTGHRGTGSDMARSFASYGHRVSGPQVGAIAVMGRRGGGHVGVVSGIDASGNPIVVSGNHGHRVAEAVYPRGRIYAYVMP